MSCHNSKNGPKSLVDKKIHLRICINLLSTFQGRGHLLVKFEICLIIIFQRLLEFNKFFSIKSVLYNGLKDVIEYQIVVPDTHGTPKLVTFQ